MSRIDREQVARIALLAQLSLSEEEIATMQRDLEQILDYVEALQQLDTDGVVPTAHALATATPLRVDRAAAAMDPELAVANAPAAEGTAFRVPKVIDEDAS